MTWNESACVFLPLLIAPHHPYVVGGTDLGRIWPIIHESGKNMSPTTFSRRGGVPATVSCSRHRISPLGMISDRESTVSAILGPKKRWLRHFGRAAAAPRRQMSQ